MFEGDLSEWGRTALENFYDEDDQSISSSHPTMSSGISPRDTQQRVKPFDLEAAREVGAGSGFLASGAGLLSVLAQCMLHMQTCNLPSAPSRHRMQPQPTLACQLLSD